VGRHAIESRVFERGCLGAMNYRSKQRFIRSHQANAPTQPAAPMQRDERSAQILPVRKFRQWTRKFAALDGGAQGSTRHFQQQFLFAITG